jgi:hypothetical protein
LEQRLVWADDAEPGWYPRRDDIERANWLIPPTGGPEAALRWQRFGHRLKDLLTMSQSSQSIPRMPLQLPPPLLSNDDHHAVELVSGYMAAAPTETGGVAYTGSLFDAWGGGGDKLDVANRFTDADINAVAMLSVEIPPTAVIELLLRRSGDLSSLLEHIPVDVDLHEAPAVMVGEGSASWRLWEALRSIPGVAWVSAGKLCARKRPRLLPVYDAYVKQLVGAPDNFWEALRQALSDDNAALAKRLRRIGDGAGAADLSILRIFDVIAWRYAKAHLDTSDDQSVKPARDA